MGAGASTARNNRREFQKGLAEIRKKDPKMISFQLYGNDCSLEDIQALVAALAENTLIKTLSLRHCKISDAGVQVLASNITLTSLDLEGNQVSDVGAQALARNLSITSLNLAGNQVSDIGTKALADNTTITVLNLSGNQISNIQMFVRNTTLQRLILSNNKVSDTDVVGFFNNATLRELNLSNNKVMSDGAIILAKNTALRSLDLSNNEVGDDGIRALAKNFTLTRLNLSGCKVGAAGAEVLAENTTLEALHLSYNQVGNAGARVLALNRTWMELILDYNDIGSAGAEALAANTTLINLSLEGNKIDRVGLQAFVRNVTLLWLNIKYCSLTMDILKELERNHTLNVINNISSGLSLYNRSSDDDNYSKWDKLTNAIETQLNKNREEQQVFLKACKSSDLTKIQLLIQDRGVSPYARYDASNWFDINARVKSFCVVTIDESALKNGNPTYFTGLHLAVIHRQSEVAKYFVTNFPHLLRFRDSDGRTSLDLAKKAKDATMLSILMGISLKEAQTLLVTEVSKTATVTISPKSKVDSKSAATGVNTRASVSSASSTTIPSDAGVIDLKDIVLNKEELLGQGGFGQVFKGSYKLAPVAIKVLLLDRLNERMLDEFQKEGQLMAKLRHPNIIEFYGVTLQQPYQIVMQYMEQGTLYDVLHSKKELPWGQRVQWAIEVGTGLHYLHTFDPQILHRDLKSLNILLGKDNQAKLTDFGLAMASLRSATKTITAKLAEKPEGAVGSLRWMAPELFSLRPKYSAASDMFAFAIVLWEMVAREIPYAQVSNDNIIQNAVTSGDREDVPSSCPEILSTIIMACWKASPEKRLSANEAVERLSKSKGTPAAEGGIAAQISRSRGYAFDSQQPAAAAETETKSIGFTSRP